MDVRLSRFERQRLVHDCAKGDLVEKATVHTGYRDNATFATVLDRFAERKGAAGLQTQCLLGTVVPPFGTGIMCLHPNSIDRRVGPASAGHLLECVADASLFVVDDLSPTLLLGHPEPLRDAVDGDNALGAEQVGALDRELPHRTAAPHCDHIARLNVARLGSHVAGRENVGEKQDLLVGEAVRNLDRPYIGKGHAGILGLPARVAADEVGVAEDAAGRIAPELFGQGSIRVRVITERPKSPFAEETVAACDRKGHNHTVTLPQILHLTPKLDDLAHELVAEDITFLHRRDIAIVEMEIGAANGGRRDFDNGIARVENLRIGDCLDPHIGDAVPADSFHDAPTPLRLWRYSFAEQGTLAGGLTGRGRDFACLHDILEPAQIARHLLVGLFAKEFGNRRPDHTGRGIVGKRYPHFHAPSGGSRDETHRTFVIHIGIRQRAPGDQLIRPIFGNLSIPRDRRTCRRFRNPVRAIVTLHLNRLEVVHETREVLEVAPEAIELIGRLVNRYALFYFDAGLIGDTTESWADLGGVHPDRFVDPVTACDTTIELMPGHEHEGDAGRLLEITSPEADSRKRAPPDG